MYCTRELVYNGQVEILFIGTWAGLAVNRLMYIHVYICIYIVRGSVRSLNSADRSQHRVVSGAERQNRAQLSKPSYRVRGRERTHSANWITILIEAKRPTAISDVSRVVGLIIHELRIDLVEGGRLGANGGGGVQLYYYALQTG